MTQGERRREPAEGVPQADGEQRSEGAEEARCRTATGGSGAARRGRSRGPSAPGVPRLGAGARRRRARRRSGAGLRRARLGTARPSGRVPSAGAVARRWRGIRVRRGIRPPGARRVGSPALGRGGCSPAGRRAACAGTRSTASTAPQPGHLPCAPPRPRRRRLVGAPTRCIGSGVAEPVDRAPRSRARFSGSVTPRPASGERVEHADLALVGVAVHVEGGLADLLQRRRSCDRVGWIRPRLTSSLASHASR